MTTLDTLVEKISSGANHLVKNCGGVRLDERVLVISDLMTKDIGQILAVAAKSHGAHVMHHSISNLTRHGEEPPFEIATLMAQSDLVIGITGFSMAHTTARLNAAAAGARYLSLPDYSDKLMADPCILTDYASLAGSVRKLADQLTSASWLKVTSELGTDITLDVRGRVANACPGIVRQAGDLGSPPDVEANISPIENASHGKIIVDGSIPFPGFGLLERPVTMFVERGEIVKFEGPIDLVTKLEMLFSQLNTRKAYVLAECGIGMNPLAELKGVMLTDEGSYGSIHFGFGSNFTVGGLNDVPIHIDFVFRRGSLAADDVPLIENGILL